MKFSSQHKLAYEVYGKGTPVVLLHGFLEDASMWEEVINHGIDGWQVITIDFPGFGESPIDKAYSIEDFGNKVEALLEELSIYKYYLFGHSMGGYVGLSVMEKNPTGVLGFGLLHSHPFADSEAGKVKRQKAIDFVNKFGSILYVKQTIPGFFPKSFANSNRFMLERLAFKASKFPVAGISNALDAMKNRPDRQAVLGNLSVPFLAIIGKKDEFLPTEQLLKQAAMAETTQIELIPNSGHMGPFEVPKLINRIIRSFIENFSPQS